MFKTEYSVRTDGLYQFRYEGISLYGEPFKLTMWLLFNKKNRAFKEEAEGFPQVDHETVRESLKEIREITETDSYCTEYYCDKGKISMKFMNSTTHGEEYSGSIIKNGLLLTRRIHYFDETLGRQNIEVSLENMQFSFIPV